jgi:predicted kinase
MNISIQPALEAKLRKRAEVQGLSVEAYVERLLAADELAHEELERLALEGLDSGDPMEIDSGYWQEKHRRLDDQLKTGTR